MHLSTILNDMNIDMKYEIIRNDEFETLGLVDSITGNTLCTFIDDEKYLESLSKNVKVVITNRDIATVINEKGICICENPRVLFFKIHNFMKNNSDYCRQKFNTIIGKDCKINKLTSISETNVQIGDNVTVEEFVVIRENTVICDNSIIRAGSIIGGTDFEFKRTDKDILAVEHLGGVMIGKNVEIQHNTSICRAIYPWDNTVIGDNSKIDDLVQISHGVKIGKNVFIVALSGIGGRTIIGNNSWIGFSTTISNGLKIGSNSRVNIGSVVTKDVADGESVSGNFAIEHNQFIKHLKKISGKKQ